MHLIGCHDGELTLDLCLLLDPVIKLDTFGLAAAHDVYNPEVVSDLDIDISCIIVFWQDERGTSLDQETDVIDFISLKVYVLVRLVGTRSQERADPTDKGV